MEQLKQVLKDKEMQWSTDKLKFEYEQENLSQQIEVLEKQLAEVQERLLQVSPDTLFCKVTYYSATQVSCV